MNRCMFGTLSLSLCLVRSLLIIFIYRLWAFLQLDQFQRLFHWFIIVFSHVDGALFGSIMGPQLIHLEVTIKHLLLLDLWLELALEVDVAFKLTAGRRHWVRFEHSSNGASFFLLRCKLPLELVFIPELFNWMVLLFFDSINAFNFSLSTGCMCIWTDSILCLFVMLVISEELFRFIFHFGNYSWLVFRRITCCGRLYLHL